MNARISFRCAVLFGLLGVGAARLDAQSGVKPGDRVRFRTDTSKSFHTAYVGRLTADSLAVEDCSTCDRLVYARTEINHLDVYRVSGRGNRLSVGALLGGVVGGLLGYLASRSCRGTADACELSALDIPFFALLGTVVGGVAGFLSAYAWQPVPASGT